MYRIVEIDELLYGRIPNASSKDWCRMLKEVYDIDSSIAVLTDDYLLLEQTESLFSEEKLVRSYRVVYNTAIEHISPNTQSLPSLDGTFEGEPEVYFDSSHDLFRVRYVHYLIESSDFVSDLHDESTDPNVLPATQAPMSEHKEVFYSIPGPAKPVQPSKPSPAPHPEVTKFTQKSDSISRKPWRHHNLMRLKQMYQAGYDVQEIMAEFNCLESSVYYQLEHSLNFKTPFDPSIWKPRKKDSTPEQVVTRPKPSVGKAEMYFKDALSKYTYHFEHLKRSSGPKGAAPHKVILMLAIMGLYRKPEYRFQNTVTMSDDLRTNFRLYWDKYVGTNSDWRSDIMMPWEHIGSEPFLTAAQTKSGIGYTIDDELRRLFVDAKSRQHLREALINLLNI